MNIYNNNLHGEFIISPYNIQEHDEHSMLIYDINAINMFVYDINNKHHGIPFEWNKIRNGIIEKTIIKVYEPHCYYRVSYVYKSL